MSYIPDVRTDDDYSVDFLNKEDKDFIRGFDYCVEYAVDNFFDNLNDLDDSYLLHIFNETVPPALREKYDFFFCNGESEEREVETYSDLFKKYLYEWVERIRDEFVTSTIDNMPDEDYDANRNAIDKDYEVE